MNESWVLDVSPSIGMGIVGIFRLIGRIYYSHAFVNVSRASSELLAGCGNAGNATDGHGRAKRAFAMRSESRQMFLGRSICLAQKSIFHHVCSETVID